MKKICVGTYTGSGSKGIYQVGLEDASFGDVRLLCKVDNPKYLSACKEDIIACCDFDEGSGMILVSKDGEIRDHCIYEKPTSCYIGSCGDYIYTANYHAGTFSRLKIEDGKIVFDRTVSIKDKAGTHQVLMHDDRLYAPCLFLDTVLIYDLDLNAIGKISFPEGSGPRHGVFKDDKMYVLSELSSELFLIDLRKNEIERSLMLCDRKVSGGAALRMSNDGRYLYASVREEDVLVSVCIEDFMVTDRKDCGGRHPRDFIVVDDLLICANRFSNDINLRRVEDGIFGDIIDKADISEPVALICSE